MLISSLEYIIIFFIYLFIYFFYFYFILFYFFFFFCKTKCLMLEMLNQKIIWVSVVKATGGQNDNGNLHRTITCSACALSTLFIGWTHLGQTCAITVELPAHQDTHAC